AGIYLLGAGYLNFNQRTLLYRINPDRVSPSDAGLQGIEEETLKTPDANRIVAWWTPPRSNGPVVLYFPGNAGNLARRADRVRLFKEHGVGILIVSYPGYAGSTGSPSEAAINASARLAYDWLAARGIASGRIVLYGESLGTGVAVQLAAARPVAGVVLDSPYTSIADMAAREYWYLPVHHLMWDRFDTMSYIGRINAPLLIIHGEQDPLVPLAMSRQVFAAAAEPKQYVTIPGQRHTMTLADGPWPHIRAFIGKVTGALPAATGGTQLNDSSTPRP
ncbi:MAG: alpha/beta hydrolase, partial [Hyphomicrobiaceae bacterium]